MSAEIKNVEMIWNEAQMFAPDLISDAWKGLNWSELPDNVQDQFRALVSEEIKHE
jgi:hypothetical protein